MNVYVPVINKNLQVFLFLSPYLLQNMLSVQKKVTYFTHENILQTGSKVLMQHWCIVLIIL